MKQRWAKRRQFKPQPDGEQRWDRAYQYLLQWSQEMKPIQTPNSDNSCGWTQEVDYASSSLCSSLYKKSS